MINFSDEPTVKDYLASIRRQWWIVGVVALAALAIGAWQAFVTTPMYKASATVLADTSTSNTRDFVDRAEVPEVARVMELLATNVLSQESVAQLGRDLELFPGTDVEKIGAATRKAISTEVTGFDQFTVTVAHADPSKAAAAANRIAEMFIAEQKRIREQHGEKTTAILASQLESMTRVLEQQDAAIKQYRVGNQGSLPGQTEGNIRAIERWQSDLRLNTQSLQRAQERLLLAEASTPKLFQGPEIEAMRAEVTGLRAERTELQKLIAMTEVKVSKAADVEGTLAEMQREYNAALLAYNDLLKRKQDASLRVELDRSRFETLFRVSEPAKVPGSPYKPAKGVILAIALFAGILGGCAAAISRDYFDETYHDAPALARQTGLPVLAVIPHTRTKLLARGPAAP